MSDLTRTATVQTMRQIQSPAASGLLQRKCACGQHTTAGGECAECAKKKSGLQRKLAIGASNDPLEREADRVADQVLAASANPAVSSALPRIQRYAGQATEGMDSAPASVGRVLASSGSPLEPALRQDMEQRFGHDFSRVRVHSGGAAEQSARDVNADAYTVGPDIVFGAGRFSPETYEGRRLVAHELTHVVQQSGSDGVRADQSNEKCGLSHVNYIRGQVILRQPSGTPGQTDQTTADEAKMRDAFKHASSVAGAAATPEEFKQLTCVINEGGTSKRDGGLPTDFEIKDYNARCKTKTGYKGKDDITPTPDQWEELKPGALDVLSPGRLKQLQSLLTEYAAVLVVGAVSPSEMAQIDAAIKQAEQQLGTLRPPGEAQKPTARDAPPWAITDKAGGALQAPVSLAAAGSMPMIFSDAVRAGQLARGVGAARLAINPHVLAAAAIAAGLVCIGYVINDYQLRKEGAIAVETLIGTLINIFRAWSDAETERRIKEQTKEKQKPDPTEKQKPDPTTDPPFSPDPKFRCKGPTGLRRSDPIEMRWFKQLSYYPPKVTLQEGIYSMHIPRELPGSGHDIGVESQYFPVSGKTIKKIPNSNKRVNSQDFRTHLALNEFNWDNCQDPPAQHQRHEADHVQDLIWSNSGAVDDNDVYPNLWPLEKFANQTAGPEQNQNQIVTFCDSQNSAVPLHRPIGDSRLLNRWFIIKLK